MSINGINYNFYEVNHPVHAILVEETANQAYERYIKHVSNEDWLHVLMNIREVSYEHAKSKLELNRGLSFTELVKASLNKDKILFLKEGYYD